MSNFLIAGVLFANRYLLHSQIGEGGIGQVWLAEDVENGNLMVALKFPKEQFKTQARFIEEAKLMAGMDHANIIKIFFVGQDEVFGEYYVMEYFPDGSLIDFLFKPACHFAKSWPNDPEIRYVSLQQAITILRPIAQALDYVHQHWPDILHRDLKLSNILVDQKHNRYVLTDFSMQVGAPSIMSPEQLLAWKGPKMQRQPLDWRSDLFSFGACLYKLTTGTYPFQVKSAPTSLEAIEEIYRYQLIDKIPVDYPRDRNSANPDLHQPEVNQLIWQLVSKSRTARTLNGRVTNMEDVLDLLVQTQKPKSKSILTPLFAVGVLLAALLLLACGLLLSSLNQADAPQSITPIIRSSNAAAAFVTQESLAGYPTSTPTNAPTPTPTESLTPEPPAPATEEAPPTEEPVAEEPTEAPPSVEEPTEEAQPVAAEPSPPVAPPLQCDEGLAIFNPPPGQVLTGGELVFQGAMPQENLDYYKIEFLPPNSTQWSCCLVDPTYGQFNPEDLGRLNLDQPAVTPGEYGLRLVAVKLDGNFNICETRITVQK